LYLVLLHDRRIILLHWYFREVWWMVKIIMLASSRRWKKSHGIFLIWRMQNPRMIANITNIFSPNQLEVPAYP
jgi:hypothetical protein